MNFVEIGGLCSMHHWIRWMDAPGNCIEKDGCRDQTDFVKRSLNSLG